ncbi:hypothetical protein CSIRO_3142 [Bradyrhizobiaceae bacterium SG-6C]|nr:hypothetical protein CSIRO_3142 [Bradyrhizobiaceae bacterium SG-6C]
MLWEARCAAGYLRRHGGDFQTQSTAHTAKMRRRRAAVMVALKIMGADISPRPFAVKR